MPPLPTTPAPEAAARPARLLLRPWLTPECQCFTYGTCEGLLQAGPGWLGIVAVTNSRKGNGDFAGLLAALGDHARCLRANLLVLEISNPRLGPHLVARHGYQLVGGGRHAFQAVAGPGVVPAEFARVRPRTALDELLDYLLTPFAR